MNEKTRQEPEKQGCSCPFCDEEIMLATLPYCRPCQVTLSYCARCEIALPGETRVCPQCGAETEPGT